MVGESAVEVGVVAEDTDVRVPRAVGAPIDLRDRVGCAGSADRWLLREFASAHTRRAYETLGYDPAPHVP